MATPGKVISPEKQHEQMMQMDVELSRLVRNCKKLEAERQKVDGGAKALRYLKLTDLLRKEYHDVISDVEISRSGAKVMTDNKNYCELNALLDEHNLLDVKVKERQAYLREMSDSIREKQKEIEVLSYKVPSNVQWQKRVQRAGKTLEGLENKLDTIVKQYSLLTTETGQLREEINHMLIDRLNFTKLWFGYIHNLNKGKKILMDVLEQTMIAYNHRDEYVVRLDALRTFALTDLKNNTREMMLLQKKLDNDHALQDFMSLKEQYRNMMDLLNKKTKKREEQKILVQTNLKHYKDLLSKIQTFSGVNCETGIENFVSRYTAIETDSMTYFNYINDLHKEIEFVNNDLVYLQINIDKQREIGNGRRTQQKTDIEALKKDLKLKTTEADVVKNGLDNVNKVLSKIYQGIYVLFKICKCSKAPFLQLLGNNSQINRYNVLLYLQVLEAAVDEYLINNYYKERAHYKGKARAMSAVIDEHVIPLPKHDIQSACPINPCPLCVDREMVSDVIDTIQFVHDKEEVRIKLAERLLLPDGLDRLHNVSACNLPKSRQIIQKRYQ